MAQSLSIIMQAKAGDKDAMGKIIDFYMPLILKHSKDDMQRIDEDCMQYLILNLICAVKKFNPINFI